MSIGRYFRYPAAFYLGCCWGVGDMPQQARNECEVRRTQGCEESSDIVHAVTGPYVRRGPFREFEGPEHNYLVTSQLQEASWGAEDGGAVSSPCERASASWPRCWAAKSARPRRSASSPSTTARCG